MLGNGIVHGMHNPATVWASDTSIYFDGVNDYVKLPLTRTSTLDALVNSIQVSVWVRIPAIGTVDHTILLLKEASGDAYIKLWYDTSEENLVLTRTDSAGSNPISVNHGYPALAITGYTSGLYTNICVRATADVLTISTSTPNAVVSTSTVTDGGGGAWDGDVPPTNLWLGLNEAGGNNPMLGWINNLAIWSGANTIDDDGITDIFNLGEPKNELETQNENLFIYHTASEREFTADGLQQFSTYTVASQTQKQMEFNGAILTGHGQTS
tara:strand:- start:615 stop:1418 length:804 start_codon:yes stop_codon:yes gene_type:complete